MDDIKVGDRVRSYDFRGCDDCYVEGVVVDLRQMDGCPRYVVEVQRVVWQNQEEYGDLGGYVYPPVNGTPVCGGGACDFVRKVEG